MATNPDFEAWRTEVAQKYLKLFEASYRTGNSTEAAKQNESNLLLILRIVALEGWNEGTRESTSRMARSLTEPREPQPANCLHGSPQPGYCYECAADPRFRIVRVPNGRDPDK